jgi:hypothetical protein
MDGVERSVRWRMLSGLAAVCVVVFVAALVPFLDSDAPAEAPQESGSAGTAPPAAAARLTAAITTAAGAASGLALVERAHTMVFASDHEHTAAHAAGLALFLRAPLVLVPTSAMSSMSPSDAASQPAPATTPAATAGERANIAQAARQRGVVRAIVVDDDAREVARDSGAREVVRVDPDASPPADPGAIIAAAADPDGAPDGPVPGAAANASEQGATPAPTAGAGSARPTADTRADLARYRLPVQPATTAALLVAPQAADALAPVVSARAVGHTVLTTGASDLRADPEIGARLADLGSDGVPPPLVLAGEAFAGADHGAVAHQAAVAMTGVELPGGGQLVIDPRQPVGRRYVGLYGVPQTAALGALGEQPVDRSVARAERIARDYQDVVDDEVDIIPCFEIIATVASSSAGDDRNFSNELPVDDLRPAVDAAGAAGVYVLLDLQPGRTDFLTQARRYRSLLREPHVGLALDPEWRLGRGERHLEQIGSVDVDEVNAVSAWLADLVEEHHLPQKMFLLHQFRLSMLSERERLNTSRDELAYVIQMDGQGPQSTKLETWRSVTADPPDGVHFGWKNFYDEDTPTRSPAGTMALDPPPVFVSYQ